MSMITLFGLIYFENKKKQLFAWETKTKLF